MFITLTKIKNQLGLDSSYDTRIQAILDNGFERQLLRRLNNRFLNPLVSHISSELVFTSSDKTIKTTNTSVDFSDIGFTDSSWIFVSGTIHNNGFKEVSTVTADTFTMVSDLTDENSIYSSKIQQCAFPEDLEILSADIIGEILTRTSGVRSESIGSVVRTYWGSLSDETRQSINQFKRVFL